jgi:hypothetical protein
VIGHTEEIGDGQGQVFRENAIPVHYAEHGAPFAVARVPAMAGPALSTHRVDLPHHPLAHASGGVGGVHDLTDELVAGHARERVVALHEFEVGGAHTGEAHTDKGFARRGDGTIDVPYVESPVFQPESLHPRDSLRAAASG